MGLSSKQVCNGGLDWTQNMLLQNGGLDPLDPPKPSQSRPQQPLQCPRCNSTSTKFCYYNNYNRSQPRHFCKTCRRHWTEGGTLRNVPVGGIRKNKRLKTSNTTNKEKNTNNGSPAATNTCNNIIIQQQLHPFADQENFSQIPQRDLRGPLLPLHPDDTISNKSSSNSSLIRASFPPVSQISPFVDLSSYHSDLSSSSEHYYSYNPTADSSIKTEIFENGYESSLLTCDELMVLPITPINTTMATTSETATGAYPDGYWNWDELGL